MERVVIIASASGCGKTTLAAQLATILKSPHVELDSIVHGPNWTEMSDDDLRMRLTPIVAAPRWVIDGMYLRKVGTLVLDAADTIVWLDLPRRVWLPRLFVRTMKRISSPAPLWNGNRETLRGAFWGKDSLFGYALANYDRKRRELPALLAGRPAIRLRTPREVDAFVHSAARNATSAASSSSDSRMPNLRR